MNKQEIFNTVATHLFNQGERAHNANMYMCRYRMSDGKKCAVGCLIPDEMYDSDMEGNGLGNLIDFASGGDYQIPHFFIEHKTLLAALQTVHDHESHWQSEHFFREKMRNVGWRYKLDTGFLNDLHFPKKD